LAILPWGLKGQVVGQLYFKITMQKINKETTLLIKQKKIKYASSPSQFSI
jgi:hypothetical protein